MDRCSELNKIYEQSGLSEVLGKKKVVFHIADNFTKLLFEVNDWNLRSIEIWDTKNGPYFRIHHLERIAEWIKARINTMPGALLRSSTKSGSSLDGDPLNLACQLRELLRPHNVGKARWTAPSKGEGYAASSSDSGSPTQLQPAEASALQALKDLNSNILDFSRSAENSWLIDRTRSYSTPFRGTLFGQVDQVEIAAELAKRPVDVLILGANPNDSGEKDPAQRPKYRSLADQIATGLYSEAYWDESGVVVSGWAANSKNSWKTLYEPLATAGVSLDCIAFANYLPWGSRTLAELVTRIEPALLRRMIALADDLLARMVRTLRPRLIIAPLSISNNLADSLITSHRKNAKLDAFNYPASRAATYRVFHGPARIGGRETKLIQLSHPSALRATSEAKVEISKKLGSLFFDQLRAG